MCQVEALPAAEVAEWQAFYRIEAEDRETERLAAEANRGLEARRARGRRR